MAQVLVLSLCVALGAAAPSYVQPSAQPIAYAAPAIVQDTLHAGPAVAHTQVEHGVIGHKTVQVGSQARQVGHEYVAAGQAVHQPAAYSYTAGAPSVTKETVQLPLAPLPVAVAPSAVAIPPPPRNLGPAPADTVTRQLVQAPVRTHTIVTPRRTHIQPELKINKVPVDVPVAVPRPVEREVVHVRKVARPYTVEVPHPVAVPAPYKVHPVHQVVETPVVHSQSYSVHQPALVAAHKAHY